MAEFVEVMKQYKRMCHSYVQCFGCPIKKGKIQCLAFKTPGDTTDFEEFEQIVMDWAKKHPVMTNRDKFKEVFGAKPGDNCPLFLTSNCISECKICPHYKFWEQEYKESKEKADEQKHHAK